MAAEPPKAAAVPLDDLSVALDECDEAGLKRLLTSLLTKSAECRQKVLEDQNLTTDITASRAERDRAKDDQYKELKTDAADLADSRDIDFYERAKFVPMRLTYDERKYLRLIDSTVHVSRYTDHMDAVGGGAKANPARKMALQMKQLCAILTGMQVAHSYEQGQQLMQNRDYNTKSLFFQTVLEIGRRYKILNPERMRDSYGKLMYFLQDSCKPDVRELLEFDTVVRVRTVYDVLSKSSRGLEMLEDPQLRIATMEIMPEGKSRMQIQREIKAKEAAIKHLSKNFCSVARRKKSRYRGYSFLRSSYADSDSEDDNKNSQELTEDEVEQCIYSLGDHSTYIRFNREPCDRLIVF